METVDCIELGGKADVAVGIGKFGGLGIGVAHDGVYDHIGNGGDKLMQAGVAGVPLAITAQGADAGALTHEFPVGVIVVLVVGNKA